MLNRRMRGKGGMYHPTGMVLSRFSQQVYHKRRLLKSFLNYGFKCMHHTVQKTALC